MWKIIRRFVEKMAGRNKKINRKSMEINWINSDEYYDTDIEKGLDKKAAIQQLILKILELSPNRAAWDSIILDKWIFNLGRLIGNIQNRNEAVGMDRDYRVALTFNEYAEGLILAEDDEDEYDQALYTYNRELEKLIKEVLADEKFKQTLQPYYLNNPFIIEVTEQGQRIGMKIEVN